MSAPFSAAFQASACPFCGVVTDVPHETQEGCIEALHVEIARMRTILGHLRPLATLAGPLDDANDDPGLPSAADSPH
jgi:hypothetical protein